jgi:hypothetical protein
MIETSCDAMIIGLFMNVTVQIRKARWRSSTGPFGPIFSRAKKCIQPPKLNLCTDALKIERCVKPTKADTTLLEEVNGSPVHIGSTAGGLVKSTRDR